MTQTTYNLTPGELFRLFIAYSAIRNPGIRARCLETIGAWAEDQWVAGPG